MGIILLIPFLIELFGDAILIRKGKKDIPVTVRLIMIVVVVTCYGFGDTSELLEGVCMALAPFPFFDVLLNLIRKKKWWYLNKTKRWDIFLNKFNPWFLLALRAIVSAALVATYFVI